DVQVNNPWQKKAESLTRSGLGAMDKGQWSVAGMMFERSLQAATLASDDQLIALGWYNLGRARASAGNLALARRAYLQAVRQADSTDDAVNSRRAGLAIAMLNQALPGGKNQPFADALLDVPATFPIDIHLAAARLAMLRGQAGMARESYARVLGMAGKDRSGLLYAARAHLGLAELEYQTFFRQANSQRENAAAWQNLNKAMDLLSRAGQPRLMLQVVNLAVALETDADRRLAWQQRAEALRRALHTASAD
ncbi:MAG: hypothetical protein Q9M23_01475, partial [Mariprofundaceae bacterium]|nr:hypothetical protein [Mariprofundaceae bacterium]